MSNETWDHQLYSVLLTTKLTLELFLYSGLLYLIVYKTSSKHWLSPVAVCLILITMAAVVIKSLLTHLLM